MPIPAVILLVFLSVCALLTAIYWSAVLFQFTKNMIVIPTARAGLRLPPPSLSSSSGGDAEWPELCIIVPAHNEASCIRTVARSIRDHDYPRLRAVFTLDRCTDATLTILRETLGDDPRFRILEIDACPAGWTGKSHAIHRAVTDALPANSERLLFLDADTELRPGCLRATVALMHARELAMLSLLSTLTHKRWFEWLIQPAAGMELVRQYPIIRANANIDRRPFANGQFIMMTRDAYAAIGGHESIRGEVLEDVSLSRQVFKHRLPAGLFLAGGLMYCRMYADLPEFLRGWKRISSEAAGRRPGRLRRNALRMRLVSTILPMVSVAAVVVGLTIGPPGDILTGVTTGLGIAGLVALTLALVGCYAAGHSPLWAIPLYPIGAWRFGGILRAAAADLDAGRPTLWAGLEYAAKKRE